MFEGRAFSPFTTLSSAIGGSDTVIEVSDISVFPPAPNLATIGVDDNAETIQYSTIAGNYLSGCVRGIEGMAKTWDSGAIIGRNFTNTDYESITSNIEEIDAATGATQSELTSHIEDTENPHEVTAEQTGSVPIGRTINGKALDSDISLGASDVEADPAGSAAAVGADLDAHIGDTDNPHEVTADQVGLGNVNNTSDADKPISAAVQTALNLKAPLANPALTGTPTAPTAAAGTKTKQIATTEFVLQNAPVPTFIYQCTGTADSTAVANIVNNFFNNGTSMAMKLIITGTMGVMFTANAAIYINATNTRGAICYLDFSDCNIPEITTASRTFFHVPSSTAKVSIFGLNVATTLYAVRFEGGFIWANNCNVSANEGNSNGAYIGGACVAYFNNCVISNNVNHGVAVMGNAVVHFNNCSVISGNLGIRLDSRASGSYFVNCEIRSYAVSVSSFKTNGFRLVNCTLSSFAQAVQNEDSNNNSFVNCTITSTDSYGMFISGSSNNNSFVNCTITSSNTGVFIQPTFSGILTFVACKISASGAPGIQSGSSNTGAIVKVIGCAIKGTSGGNNDIWQTSAASTMTWHIMGNSFYNSAIHADGAARTVSTATTNSYLYMPAYANQFSRTIE